MMREIRSVQIEHNKVYGAQDGQVLTFKGIPFAKPPVDELRGRHAVPTPDIENDVVALSYRPSPPQIDPLIGEEFEIMSEDCLYLNIWTPSLNPPDRPVIVWIYGGGFQGGSASTEMTNGSHIAEQGDLVFVTLNHRVGFLGFGTSNDENGKAFQTNFGLTDVIAGLKWVQKNISSFGGNPRNITLMGHSSGAFMAAALLASPQASGLFSKIILISGGTSRVLPLARAQALMSTFRSELKASCETSFEEASPEQILDVQSLIIPQDVGVRNSSTPNALGVVLDQSLTNPVLSAHPMEIVVSGGASTIPLLIAFCESEVSSFRRCGKPEDFEPISKEALVREVTSWGIESERSNQIVSKYLNTPECIGDIALTKERILTDWIYKLPALRLAEAQAAAGGSAWVWQFTSLGITPFGHGDEFNLLFGRADMPGKSELERNVSNELQGVVVRFAREGNPGWAQYSAERPIILNLGGNSQLRQGDFEQMLHLWDGVTRP